MNKKVIYMMVDAARGAGTFVRDGKDLGVSAVNMVGFRLPGALGDTIGSVGALGGLALCITAGIIALSESAVAGGAILGSTMSAIGINSVAGATMFAGTAVGALPIWAVCLGLLGAGILTSMAFQAGRTFLSSALHSNPGMSREREYGLAT